MNPSKWPRDSRGFRYNPDTAARLPLVVMVVLLWAIVAWVVITAWVTEGAAR